MCDHLKSCPECQEALKQRDVDLREKVYRELKQLEQMFRARSKSYEQPGHEEFNYADGKMLAFNRCADELLAAIAKIREGQNG